jgi:hypothetical protein
LPEPSRLALQGILGEPQWYVSFFGTTKRLGLSRQWGLYKREHPIRLFTEALHNQGISAATAAPKHDLRAARALSRRPSTPRRSNFDDIEIRELVSRLALALPIDELRSIRMPLGLILDALSR